MTSLDDVVEAEPTSGTFGSPVVFHPQRLIDFVIHVGPVSYHVHKYVLAAHSAYFRQYFDCEDNNESDAKRLASIPCEQTHRPGLSCMVMPPDSPVCVAGPKTFQLFLWSLYYPQKLKFPPCTPGNLVLDAISADEGSRLYHHDLVFRAQTTASGDKKVLLRGTLRV